MAAQNGISSTSPQDGAPPRASIGVCADSRAAEKSEGSRSKAANPPPAFEFLDLRAQFAGIREEVMYAVSRVMESQRFILGEEVRLFEEELAEYLGARHAIACASGSDALALALMSLGIGVGDEVITSPFTFVATAGSIARVGAKPVFVDIEAATFNINSAEVQAAITPRTRAILPVHLFGLSANLDALRRIAETSGLAVIEDAAQAIGALYKETAAGTSGNLGCFSFFPSKNLGGAGDGGLVVTNDAALADRIRVIRTHGSRSKYSYERLGLNSRLDALQAAILRVKLRYLSSWTAGRRNRAARYRRLFEQAGLLTRITLPCVPAGCHHAYNQFTIRCKHRDTLRQFLSQRGIPAEIYYPEGLHVQPAFEYLGYRRGQFPHTETACKEVLSLPVFPELTDAQQDCVVEAISEFYRSGI